MSKFDQRIKESSFLIASDVQNPLIGKNGASHVFGPQKGATFEDVILLDQCMTIWADSVEEVTGVHLHDMPGAGAAVGIGGAFQAFFPSKMKRGIDIVIEYTHLHQACRVLILSLQEKDSLIFRQLPEKWRWVSLRCEIH